jgi:hypothetical protein
MPWTGSIGVEAHLRLLELPVARIVEKPARIVEILAAIRETPQRSNLEIKSISRPLGSIVPVNLWIGGYRKPPRRVQLLPSYE